MRFLSGEEGFSLRALIRKTKFSYPERAPQQSSDRGLLSECGLYLFQTVNQALTFLLGLLRWSKTQNQ